MNKSPDNLPKALRLFLSVDIAGSTAYKSQDPLKVQPWLPALFKFFREFPVQLAGKYIDGQPPVLWKTLGDEIVFVTQIKNHLEVSTHLCHFRDTIASYRETIKSASKKLDLKGAAWLAGFPVGNTYLKLPRDIKGEIFFEDYVGPSIDNGFRLSKHATPRKFVLSVEAAYLLLASANPSNVPKPQVSLEHGEELKGVLGGRPYPKLWISIPHSPADKLRELEERLLDPPPSNFNEGDIREFCRLFIEEHGTPLFKPFIEGDSIFGTPPDGYNKQFKELEQLLLEHQMGQHLKNEPSPDDQKKLSPGPGIERGLKMLEKRSSKKTSTRSSGKSGSRKPASIPKG